MSATDLDPVKHHGPAEGTCSTVSCSVAILAPILRLHHPTQANHHAHSSVVLIQSFHHFIYGFGALALPSTCGGFDKKLGLSRPAWPRYNRERTLDDTASHSMERPNYCRICYSGACRWTGRLDIRRLWWGSLLRTGL